MCAVLAVAEEIPQTSKNIIASLQAEGIRTMMMTGDTKEAALRAASFVGIEKYMGALSPQEKLETGQQYQPWRRKSSCRQQLS